MPVKCCTPALHMALSYCELSSVFFCASFILLSLPGNICWLSIDIADGRLRITANAMRLQSRCLFFSLNHLSLGLGALPVPKGGWNLETEALTHPSAPASSPRRAFLP